MDVCVTVLNGILVNSLTVNIDLLPSTAIGKLSCVLSYYCGVKGLYIHITRFSKLVTVTVELHSFQREKILSLAVNLR